MARSNEDHELEAAAVVEDAGHGTGPEILRQGGFGRLPLLKRAIAQFVADARRLPAAALPERWSQEVEANLNERISPPTRKNYVSRYRAALSEALGPSHPALQVVNGRGLSAEITRTNAAKLAAAPSTPAGRPSVLRDAVAGFVDALRRETDPDRIQALWDRELASHEGKADRTIKLYASQYYRPAIQAAFGDDHPALAIVRAPEALSDRIRSEDKARVAESHRRLVGVPQWREIVARGTRLLRSREPMALAAGLLCVTGRRPYEVFCTGTFAPAAVQGAASRAASRWTVTFNGQAKTKGRPGTRQDAYEIPVLAEARDVIAAFRALRASPEGQEWAGLDNKAFSRLITSARQDERILLADAVTDAFGASWPVDNKLTPRSLRPLYAEIAYRHFGSARVSKNSFVAAILGHSMNDLETSLSYMDYHLGDEDKARASAAGLADRFLATDAI